jgi:SNF2 family DNA or RNA helicase
MWNQPKLELYNHQSELVEWMKKTESNNIQGSKGGVVFADMGLGKTFSSLEYIRLSGRRQTLIVCSKSLVSEWINQIKKFYPDNGPKVFAFHNDFNKDIKKLTSLQEYDIVITTYNAVMSSNKNKNGNKFSDSLIRKYDEGFVKKWVIEEHNKRKNISNLNGTNLLHTTQWDDIIIDECQNITTWTTSSFQSCYSLLSKHTFCLSGTPIKNNKAEFIAILKLIGVVGYNTPSHWKSKDESIDKRTFSLFKKIGYEDTDITLPDIIEHNIYTDFNEKTKNTNNHYLNVWKEYSSDSKSKKMSKLMGLFIRFRQLSIDPSLITEKLPLSSEKFKELVKIITDISNRNEKVVLFSSFTGFLIKFNALFGDIITFIVAEDTTVKRADKIEEWKTDPNKPVLMMNYRIGCEGLNLVEANNVILLDSWWNQTIQQQAIARCRRIGQTEKVNVYKLTYNNSIETVMDLKSKNKLNLFEQLKNDTYYKNLDKHKLTFDVMNGLINDLSDLQVET